ncbi:MAG TPA: FAD-binding protein [Amycolatopsis sp.]|jgi:electron transfer flavoprotein alpha subunit|nr:FAD-binding protein [Amycolatopsis sp.]
MTEVTGAAGLRTVALIKQVPLGDHSGHLDEQGRLRRAGLATEMNPWCRRAVTQAVDLAKGGGHSTVVTMGPPQARDVLREALACGADAAIHVSDPVLAGADCLITSRALTGAIRELGGVDVILVGRSSVDGSTGAIGPMVAELLGLPFTGPALNLSVEDDHKGPRAHCSLQLEGASEDTIVTLPAVVSVAERSCRPAKAPAADWPDPARIRSIGAGELGGGIAGTDSPTRVVGTVETPRTRQRTMLTGEPGEQVTELIDQMRNDRGPGAARTVEVRSPRAVGLGPRVLVLAASGREEGTRALLHSAAKLAGQVGGRVVVALADAAETDFVSWAADEVVVLDGDEPRQIAAALGSWLGDGDLPWAVLGGTSEREREVLGRLGARLGVGLMSDLIDVTTRRSAEGGSRLLGLKPSGNGVLAEIECVRIPQIAAVRTGNLELPPFGEPRAVPVSTLPVLPDPRITRSGRKADDDYDALERAEVVIGVGSGVDPADYELLEELRVLLGAEFAATRKVTDAGWLPHARQVGITARSIAPRCYLALGISGSMNHLSGLARAETILAVNSDPAAPIFAHADVGIVADWREIVPLLAIGLARRSQTSA